MHLDLLPARGLNIKHDMATKTKSWTHIKHGHSHNYITHIETYVQTGVIHSPQSLATLDDHIADSEIAIDSEMRDVPKVHTIQI